MAETPIALQGQEVTVTVSIGGAVCQGESMDELLDQADDALYGPSTKGATRVVMSRTVAEVEAENATAVPPRAPLSLGGSRAREPLRSICAHAGAGQHRLRESLGDLGKLARTY